MLILPAIDLLEGRVVRLHQGRFDRVTVYSEEPLDMARRWLDEGAEALHIVDLEGARLGKAHNLDSIYGIRSAFPEVLLEVGGGIRTFALACRLLDAGIDRVVFGTAAVRDPRLLRKLRDRYEADRIVGALDLREGRLTIEGWEEESERGLEDVLAGLRQIGIEWVACTEVARDGTLSGPGLDTASVLIDRGFRVIVAGGIHRPEQIRALRSLGAAGCIIGSALYEGALDLGVALEAARAD